MSGPKPRFAAQGLLLRLVCWSAMLGVGAGTLVAVLRILREHYLQQGLVALAAGTLRESLLVYGPAALVGAVLAVPLLLAASRFARSGRLAGVLVGLAAAVAALPIAAMLLRHEAWLLPAASLRSLAVVVAWWIGIAGGSVGLLRGRFGAPRTLRVVAGAALGFAAFALLIEASGWLVPRAVGDRPNVLLVMLDTVRADRLSAYGYARPTTPELDAFAKKAIRYTDFYSTSSWTVPSHASLFTGMYSARHGATQENVRLAARFATLAEILRNAGYQTFGVSGNPWVSSEVNLSQGFERFIDTWRDELGKPPQPRHGPHPANTAFADFLVSASPQQPFFAFVHYMDAHSPFLPPEPYRSRFLPVRRDPVAVLRLAEKEAWIRHYRGRPHSEADLALLSDLYDGGLAYLSAVVGRLLETLEASGRYDDTLIVVASDHGEHFGENELVGHMFGLYNTAVRVPLLLRPPGGERAGEVDRRKGQLVDLFATLIGAAGLDASAFPHRGVDLLAEPGELQRDAIFSEYYYPAQVLSQFSSDELEAQASVIEPYRRRMHAIQRYGFRFIWSSNGHHELYDLRADPLETRNLYAEEPRDPVHDEFLALLRAELEQFVPDLEAGSPGAEGSPPVLDPETLEALRAVGYVR